MMQKNITDKFIEIILNMSESELPNQVINQATRCLIDYIGVTTAGAFTRSKKNRLLLNELRTHGKIPVIGTGECTDLFTAALTNGMNAHEVELDDGHRHGTMHPASPIMSSLLPVAYQNNVFGEDLLRGIVLGYEAAIRLACAVQPYHKEHGFHTTGTCGTIGAAVGIGIMLRYSCTQLKAVLSAAVSSAAGVLENIEDCSELKPYNAGRAALDAVAAAYVGKNDKGPDNILGGKRGFLSVFGGCKSSEHLFQSGNYYAIEKIYFKPYASCRFTHAPLEAAYIALCANNLDIDNIDQVEIYTYKAAVFGQDHKNIQGSNSAKMSIPYCVACMLVTGQVGIQSFTNELLQSKKIHHLMDKITINIDYELTAAAPGIRAAIAVVKMRDGAEFIHRVDYPKGEPEYPMPDADIEQKFSDLLTFSERSPKKIAAGLSTIRNVKNDSTAFLELLKEL